MNIKKLLEDSKLYLGVAYNTICRSDFNSIEEYENTLADIHEIIRQIHQALATMREPYGYAYVTDAGNGWTRTDFSLIRDIGMLEKGAEEIPIYTAPPKLSDEEIKEYWNYYEGHAHDHGCEYYMTIDDFIFAVKAIQQSKSGG